MDKAKEAFRAKTVLAFSVGATLDIASNLGSQRSGCMKSRLITWGAISSIFLVFGQDVCAQGTLTVMNTGGGLSLVSLMRTLVVDQALNQPRLLFNFGFATDEIFSPDTFLDSFTVTIQDTNHLSTSIFLTADAGGTVVAPPTDGTLLVDPATVNLQSVAYPSLQPLLATRRAFSFSGAIPFQFIGQPIDIFFDLFDNLNSTASQAWFSEPSVVAVPEPEVWTFWVLGAVVLKSIRFRKS